MWNKSLTIFGNDKIIVCSFLKNNFLSRDQDSSKGYCLFYSLTSILTDTIVSNLSCIKVFISFWSDQLLHYAKRRTVSRWPIRSLQLYELYNIDEVCNIVVATVVTKYVFNICSFIKSICTGLIEVYISTVYSIT